MTTTPAAQLGRFVGALAILAGLLAGAPLALAIAAQHRFGSPFPLAGVASPATWDIGKLANGLRERLDDDTVIDVIARASLVIAWLALLVVVCSTIAEVAHRFRHFGMAMPAVRGLGWAQRPAQFIAAGLLVLTPLTAPRSSLAVASPADTIDGSIERAVAAQRVHHNLFDVPGEDVADLAAIADAVGSLPQEPTAYVVERGDSIYSIAECLAPGTSLTTTEFADALLDLNLDREMIGGRRFNNPAYIEVGWELILPADAARPAEATSAPPHDATSHGSTSGDPGRHVVADGETLSSIAEHRLDESAEWPTIWAANANAVMNDGRVFDDPNLILPGWELEIPDVAAEPTTDTATGPTVDAATDTTTGPTVDAPTDTATDTGTDTPDDAPVGTPTDSTPADISADAPEMAALPDGAPTPTPPFSTTATPAAVPDAVGTVAPAPDDGDADLRAPLRFEFAAALATGLMALLGVRRRRRLRTAGLRARIPPPPAAVVDTERRLRAIDAGERSTRLDVAVRAIAHALIGSNAQIGLVTVGAAGDIDVTLTRRAELPAPWNTVEAEAGTRWTLGAEIPIEHLAEDARRVGAPCVALVQIGRADDRDVLIDLEACGTLAVESASSSADDIVTAIATGLASSPFAEVAHIVAVALPQEALLDHRNAHRADSVASAAELATSLGGSTMTNPRTTFSLRSLRTGGEVWEPVVIVLTSEDREGRAALDSMPIQAGHGLAVVAVTGRYEWHGAQARLCEHDVGWTLAAFGATVPITPVGVDPHDLRQLVDVLDETRHPFADAVVDGPAGGLVDDVAATTQPTAPRAAGPAGAEPSDDDDRDGDHPIAHSIVVRLMGGVEVVSREGEPGVFERSKSVELIAWLATHRGKSTRSAARTALWELDVRDATFANVVSEARRGLGRLVTPPDDEEWLARTLTEHLPLHPAVVTDAQLMEQRLTVARSLPIERAIEMLRPAADMIRDVPFAGTGYLWPDAEGITSNLVLLAIAVSGELATHALALGDTELVFWATGRGLMVLPGHEELIGLRMRAHGKSGDLAGVRQEWESYERVIHADAWSDGEPAPKLLDLRRELLP